MTSTAPKTTRPEFSRAIRVARLPQDGMRFSETATAEERAALARRYGALAVKRFAIEGRLTPSDGGWLLSGVARARLTLTCVVTLAPVDQIIEERFSRLHLPGAPEPDLLDLDPEGDDPPEPLGDYIDPAEAAAESVALAIDPYPRADGVVFGGRLVAPDGADPLTEEASRPFASLAALRARLTDDDAGGDGGGDGGGDAGGDAEDDGGDAAGDGADGRRRARAANGAGNGPRNGPRNGGSGDARSDDADGDGA